MNGNYAGFNYDEEVVFPFGYGLSYTTFSKEFASTPIFNESTNEYTFKVKITNTGNKYSGKDVAQIYVNVPYTKGGIEKSHVTLAGFAKSKLLAPGESDTVEIKVNRDYITSYDYKNEKCYVFEKGDYNFYLMENAHSWVDIDKMTSNKDKVLWTDSIAKTFVYKDSKDGKRLTDVTTATNKEDDELNYNNVDKFQINNISLFLFEDVC